MIQVTKKLTMASICAWLLLAGCRRQAEAPPPLQPVQVMKQAPPTPIAEKKVELGEQTWNPQWDLIVEGALSPEMLSNRMARAVRPFCPRFASLSNADKRAFWAYTFQALAGAEAGLKPTTDVRHSEPEVAVEDTVSKRTVRQEGLLQLTYMDADRYGCNFDWKSDKRLPANDPEKTILQPRNNLLCGVKILENQLITLKRPLLTESSYWVTLRPRHPSYQVFAKQMKNVPAGCRLATPPEEEAKRGTSHTPEAAAAMPVHAPAAAN